MKFGDDLFYKFSLWVRYTEVSRKELFAQTGDFKLVRNDVDVVFKVILTKTKTWYYWNSLALPKTLPKIFCKNSKNNAKFFQIKTGGQRDNSISKNHIMNHFDKNLTKLTFRCAVIIKICALVQIAHRTYILCHQVHSSCVTTSPCCERPIRL